MNTFLVPVAGIYTLLASPKAQNTLCWSAFVLKCLDMGRKLCLNTALFKLWLELIFFLISQWLVSLSFRGITHPYHAVCTMDALWCSSKRRHRTAMSSFPCNFFQTHLFNQSAQPRVANECNLFQDTAYIHQCTKCPIIPKHTVLGNVYVYASNWLQCSGITPCPMTFRRSTFCIGPYIFLSARAAMTSHFKHTNE